MTLKDQHKWKTKISQDGEYFIPCKYGVINLLRTGELDVWATNTRIAKRIETKWKAKQHYDDGALFIRSKADLDMACIFLKAGKKRQITEAMRERGRELASRMQSLEKKARQSNATAK